MDSRYFPLKVLFDWFLVILGTIFTFIGGKLNAEEEETTAA